MKVKNYELLPEMYHGYYRADAYLNVLHYTN